MYLLYFCEYDLVREFASGIGDQKIDIGLEIHPEYRQRGLATLIASQMIAWALENGMIPDWGCAATNTGSHKTALRIGFDMKKTGYFYSYE